MKIATNHRAVYDDNVKFVIEGKLIRLTKHGADWRAVHEIQFGGSFNVSSSINVSTSSPTAQPGVMPQLLRHRHHGRNLRSIRI